MFDYPLKKREIYLFLGNMHDHPVFEETLEMLVNETSIFKSGEFYCLHNNFDVAEKRLKGNALAARMLKKAGRAAAIIAWFPFVKGVAVSGSLSKNFADETADIDFFVITKANRLWIARTLLHVFKKFTFLAALQKYFCMNYFVSEAQLCIVEKNVYTATEIATLMPLNDDGVFESFFSSNSWTKNFLPNNYMRVSSATEIKKSRIRIILERLLDNRAGDWLDDYFMKLTTRSWDRKTRRQKKNSRGIVMSMNAAKQHSKPNPTYFQQKLLLHYENDLNNLWEQLEISSSLSQEIR